MLIKDFQLFEGTNEAAPIKSLLSADLNHENQIKILKVDTDSRIENTIINQQNVQLPREEGIDFPDTMNNVDITFRNEHSVGLVCNVQVDRKPKPDIQVGKSLQYNRKS